MAIAKHLFKTIKKRQEYYSEERDYG